MGTFGRDTARDNWFFSDGALDNQAWAQALAVAATGRITQLTAYMAGDTAAMTGGPALWDAAGNLLLYSATGIARRSGPYSGGFDGTGRNANDGYYINVYGFNHTFTNPTTFINGAFRNSGDSWILGNSDHFGNIGRLKTVVGGSPSTATGGNDWAHEAAGFPGFPEGYATYTPLGIFARVGGVFVPVTMKRFFDTVTTYFNTVVEDLPIDYFRVDETGQPWLNYGSRGTDGIDGSDGPFQATHVSAVIVDADKAVENFGGNTSTGAKEQLPNAVVLNKTGYLNFAMEAWFKLNSAGPSNLNPIFYCEPDDVYGEGTPLLDGSLGHGSGGIYVVNGTDLTCSWLAQDYPGLENQAGYVITIPGVVSVGPIYHVVARYTCGTDFAGDGNPIARNGNGKIDVLVNGVNVYHANVDSFRPTTNGNVGDLFPSYDFKIGYTTRHYGDFGGTKRAADATIDECATYGNNVLSGIPVLSDARIAHHYAVGTGSTGGLASTGATLYVRNDSNTAWIALNFALKQQEMPERREFPVRAVYPDGSYKDLLGRWEEDNPQTFGATLKDAFRRAKSGLFVPARSQRVLGYA